MEKVIENNKDICWEQVTIILDYFDRQSAWPSSPRSLFGQENGAIDPTTTTGQTQAWIKTSI